LRLNDLQYLSAVLLLLCSVLVYADDARPAYLELKEVKQGSYDISWKRPEIAGRAVGLAPVFPERCEIIPGLPARSLSDMRVESYRLDCGDTGIVGSKINIDGLTTSMRDVLLKIIFTDYSLTHILGASAPSIIIQAVPDTLQVIKDYLLLGVSHILTGFDHLLFVLALLFLVSGLKELVKAITAFTLSHSVTLAGAALGWVSIPLAPVETCIALSILFLAVEMIHKIQGKTSFTLQRPWLAALGFGLIHGFGFAGALTEVGLPPTDIPLALLFFNLGVELGQLIFVIPIYLLLKAIDHSRCQLPLEYSVSYVIGTISVFWMIERILLF
jgi:hydrogenase/urease accessory protein HupE